MTALIRESVFFSRGDENEAFSVTCENNWSTVIYFLPSSHDKEDEAAVLSPQRGFWFSVLPRAHSREQTHPIQE